MKSKCIGIMINLNQKQNCEYFIANKGDLRESFVLFTKLYADSLGGTSALKIISNSPAFHTIL